MEPTLFLNFFPSNYFFIILICIPIVFLFYLILKDEYGHHFNWISLFVGAVIIYFFVSQVYNVVNVIMNNQTENKTANIKLRLNTTNPNPINITETPIPWDNNWLRK